MIRNDRPIIKNTDALSSKKSHHLIARIFITLLITTVAILIVPNRYTKYSLLKFNVETSYAASNFQPTPPFYSTFFYIWYKNTTTDGGWSYWTDHQNNPPNTWFSHYLPDLDPTTFNPATELYSANNYTSFKWQVSKLAEAKQEVAIASWWGQNTKEDFAFDKIVNDFMSRPDNPYPNLRWAIYYENEGFADPSVAELVSDLNHIKTQFASSPYFLKINGKPVVFVYAANDVGSTNTNCSDPTDTSVIHRWYSANNQVGNSFYIVLKVYPGFATNPCQPDSWHQYSPAVRQDQQSNYSYMVSPGFWLDDGSAERLPRDSTAFEGAVRSMVAANTMWKLTETWNEWGEGTSVEPGQFVRLNTSTGNEEADPTASPDYAFHNLYVDILNRNLPSLEQGTGTNTTLKIGDINGDSNVDLNDFSIMLSEWGTNSSRSDLSHDGTVSLQDLSILLSHWGT